jgi:hypothetical protein
VSFRCPQAADEKHSCNQGRSYRPHRDVIEISASRAALYGTVALALVSINMPHSYAGDALLAMIGMSRRSLTEILEFIGAYTAPDRAARPPKLAELDH